VTPEWRLINGLTGQMICKFVNETKAHNWLAKQLADFPDGYFKENRCRIERYPRIEGQVDLFELLA
jgi:hypothetical protein